MGTPPPKFEPLIVPRASERPPPPKWPLALIGVGVLIAALVLFVVVTARPGDPSLYPGGAQPKITIYLVDNGFHSDLVVPRQALFARPHPAALAAAMATDKPWVVVGWGDARFYSQQGFSLARAFSGLRALLLPGNRSVVHIEGLASSPNRVYADGVRPIQVTQAGLERVVTRIDRSLDMDSDGQPQRSTAPHPADTGFFRSVEHFSLAHLCNHWTADLLDAAGLPTTPVIDTLPVGLEADLRLRAGVK